MAQLLFEESKKQNHHNEIYIEETKTKSTESRQTAILTEITYVESSSSSR